MSIPEPKSFNAGPGETGNFAPSGPREEPSENPRGGPCACCGLTIHRVYTLAGVGAFCSPRCRNRGPRIELRKVG